MLPGEFPVRSDSEHEVETSPSIVPTGLSKEDMESVSNFPCMACWSETHFVP